MSSSHSECVPQHVPNIHLTFVPHSLPNIILLEPKEPEWANQEGENKIKLKALPLPPPPPLINMDDSNITSRPTVFIYLIFYCDL